MEILLRADSSISIREEERCVKPCVNVAPKNLVLMYGNLVNV